MKRLAAPVVLLAMMLCGCSFPGPLPPEPKKEVLAKLPSDLPHANDSQQGLLIPVPEAEPVFDTTRMAYTRKPYEIGYFTGHEWAGRPAQMIQALLITALAQTHRFREVIEPPEFSTYEWVLNTRLLALTQDYTHSPPEVHVALRVRLVSRRDARVVASQDLVQEEVISGSDPHAGVVAANEAVARIVRDAALFVLEKTGD